MSFQAFKLLKIFPVTPQLLPEEQALQFPEMCIQNRLLFTEAKRWRRPKCSRMDEWGKKMRSIHGGVLVTLKKEGELDTYAPPQMNLEGVTLSERSQTEEQYCMSPPA
jgi:hypothetical protein